MAKYEILRVDMDVSGAQEQGFKLEEVLAQVKDDVQDTAASIVKAFGAASKNMKNGLSSFWQLYKELATGSYVRAANGSLNRTVSGFDELNRLAKKNAVSVLTKQNQELMDSTLELVNKVDQLGTGIKEKVLQPIGQWATEQLGSGLSAVGQKLGELFGKTQEGTIGVNGYGSAWEQLNLKTSFWKDLITEVSGTTGVFNEALRQSGLAAGSTGQEMEKLNLQISGTSGQWLGLKSAAQSVWENILSQWGGSGSWFSQNVSQPVGTEFSGMLNKMERAADISWSSTKSVFSDAGGYFSEVFSRVWKDISAAFGKDGEVFVDVQDGVLSGFKDAVNQLIDGINKVTTVPFSGLNTALGKLQGIKIGNLQPFSFLSWRATVPKIPHLAQGAVLPANRPFLAMVGDQRHGTNIEAPLATIQEAVALSMEDFMAGNMAGHEATVEVLRQILGAVMGISIGDQVIAEACDRYNAKMAIVRGR